MTEPQQLDDTTLNMSDEVITEDPNAIEKEPDLSGFELGEDQLPFA